MANKFIYGIQQIGIGVPDASQAFQWYGKHLGSDILVFDDDNTATHMAKYMGGAPHEKRALLAMNLQGGGGYELWQYLDREPQPPHTPLQAGDLGIYAARVKAKNVEQCFENFQEKGIETVGGLLQAPDGNPFFFMRDPYGNILQVLEFNSWYRRKKHFTGGVCGTIIGVSDVDRARTLYSDVLGYDQVVYDQTGSFADLACLPGGDKEFRRILLEPSKERKGGFSPLFGHTQLELWEVRNRAPQTIFENRYWGDLGYIHLCFDVKGMRQLRQECEEKGFPFRVDSQDSFEMGEAAGHWGYIEDPDGTLIEFVETHKIPIIKKWNWYLNLRNRNPTKPLPSYLINALSFSRVKM